MQPHIEFKNVTKRYRIGHGFPSLRSALTGRGNSKAPNIHWAVRQVSFELQSGEALGIIGPNGAGKTTILKLLSQVTKPTSGDIIINGRLSALIELGAGFHPDLTGRENIYLNGTILGMRRSEINDRFDQIVDFAGIGDYLDTPVKRYSSGMYARLGFAIAAHVDPQILLVDEVLAVGDYAFQTKCFARMNELRDKGTSMVFVSHNMEAVRRVCDRGLVMYRGENIFQGSANEAVIAYSNALRTAARNSKSEVPEEGGLSQRVMTFDAEIKHVRMLNEKGKPASMFTSNEPIAVEMEIAFYQKVRQPIFSFLIRTPEGRLVYNSTTGWMQVETPEFSAGESCRVTFRFKMPLLNGEYELGVDIAAADLSHYYDRVELAQNFWVKSSGQAKGLVDLDAKVTIERMAMGQGMYDFSKG